MTELPEMKFGFMLGFRTSPFRIEFFEVVAWEVWLSQTVEVHPGRLEWGECKCASFRYDEVCKHLDLATKAGVEFFVSGRGVDGSVASHWYEDEFRFVGLSIGDTRGVLAADIGNISLYDLGWMVMSDGSAKRGARPGYVNPRRLYVECKASLDEGVSIGSYLVDEAGMAVPME